MFLFIGGPEVFIILLIVVMVFGADKIPEIARGLAKGMSQVRNATDDIKKEITKNVEKSGVDVNVTKDIKKAVDDVKENIEDMTGPIRRNR